MNDLFVERETLLLSPQRRAEMAETESKKHDNDQRVESWDPRLSDRESAWSPER